VAYKAAGTQNDAGELKLGPTGSIRGKVRSADPQVTSFLGTRVFIPGTSFNADPAPDGTYVISGVPEGQFILAAYSIDQGGVVSTLPALDWQRPGAMAREANGKLLVCDTNHRLLYRVYPATGEKDPVIAITRSFLDGVLPIAQASRPTGVAAGPDGTVYFVDQPNRRIRKIC